MMKTWMKIILILCCYYQASVKAETVDIELKYYNKASYLVGQGKFKQAAEQWHQLSLVFLRSEAQLGNRNMWQYAGLAEALAAISADKVNSVTAYQYWADSTRFLMTGGTNWQLMRKQLHRRFETINTQLSVFMQVSDLSANSSDSWQQDLSMLQLWNDKLAVFAFVSPKLGLTGKQTPTVVMSQNNPISYKGAFQPNKKLTGLGMVKFHGKQIMPGKEPTTSNTSKSALSLPAQNELKIELSESEKLPARTAQAALSRHVTPIPEVDVEVLAPVLSTKMSVVESNDITPNVAIQHQFVNSEHEIEDVRLSVVSAALGTTPTPLAKGNMATIEEEKIEPLQRRSFTPVTQN